ncbi:MAG: MSCRAMM family protein [Acidimicrobiales bacterium]
MAPGSYKIRFQDCVAPLDYAAEYFDNKPDHSSANTVSVSEGVTTSGVNGSLAIGGRISGTVVADGSGTPLAGICVSAPNASTGSSLFRVITSADGIYNIAGLAAGTYKVKFEDCNSPFEWGLEYYDNKPDFGSGTVVSVSGGANTSGINASMAPGGNIAGTVVADGSGSPLAGICVFPFPSTGGGNISSTTTAADGTYTLGGLPVGAYRVRFQDCTGSIDWAVEHYDNKLDFGPANLVFVSASSTVININASLAPGARISGTVVAEGSGAPLAGICVGAPFASTNSNQFRVTTGADGTYTLAGLAASTYKIRFDDCTAPVEYAVEYYDNKPDFTSGNTVAVATGATVSGINAAMAIGGAISGSLVADGSGTPLSGICVGVSVPTGGFVGSATTGAGGTYLLAGVAAGSYKVRFDDCVSPIDYASEYYDNKLGFNAGDTVNVTAGATTTGINAGLAIGGRISGTVVADGSGSPVSGICVSPSNTATNSSLFRVTTAADGTFAIAGLAAGSYKVRFEDCSSPIEYAAEYYHNKPDSNSGDVVNVVAGATASGVNASLAIGGAISGNVTVTAGGGGAPLAGICVGATNVSTGASLFRPTTGPDGTYSIAGLVPGSYRIRFDDCVNPVEYASEYYNNKWTLTSADSVVVTAGNTTSGVNAGLGVAGSISGTVVADGSGTPLSGICVTASNVATGANLFRPMTAADGTYTITGLAAGTYKVRYEDCVNPIEYAVEYYDNKPEFNPADPVNVTAGATTPGINASLAIGGAIAGTVVADGSGTPLAGICVIAFIPSTGFSYFRPLTAADGTYVVAGLPAGSYKVRFEDCVSPIEYAAEYYENKGDPTSANTVSVTAGNTLTVNGSLAIAGAVSGTVTPDGTGTPLAGICISSFHATTGFSFFRPRTAADGTYLVTGLVPGSYRVRFQDCASPPNWVTEYYNDKPDSNSADLVVVNGGATTSGINAALAPTPDTNKPADFDGDGDTDRAVYRNGAWFAEGQATAFFGLSGDIPVPADYDGNGHTDKAVFRQGGWFIEGQATVYFGLSDDIPVPGDYNGDGTDERAVYRPAVGGWYVEGQAAVFFGNSTDIPVPGDYDGNGTTDIAVFRPSVGGWYVNGQATVFTGLNGDIPVPGDYDASGTTDKAVFRPSVGGWYVNGQATVFTGLSGDIPVPGDYDGDGDTDRAVWRKDVGGWYVNGQSTVFLGLSGDIPLPLPQAIYRNFFTP